jgi:hypothetical protein
MKITRWTLIGLVVGALAVGSAVGSVWSVSAQTPTPEAEQAPESPQTERAPGPKQMRGGGGPKNAIRSESVLPPREEGGGFVTVRTDQGEISAKDGSSISVKEADGPTAQIPVGSDTRIRRDGAEATLDDLQVGDHVFGVREKVGDGEWTTRGVRAVSAERWAEIQARREACTADPTGEDCPRPRRGRGGPGRFGPPPGAPAEDASAATA